MANNSKRTAHSKESTHRRYFSPSNKPLITSSCNPELVAQVLAQKAERQRLAFQNVPQVEFQNG